MWPWLGLGDNALIWTQYNELDNTHHTPHSLCCHLQTQASPSEWREGAPPTQYPRPRCWYTYHTPHTAHLRVFLARSNDKVSVVGTPATVESHTLYCFWQREKFSWFISVPLSRSRPATRSSGGPHIWTLAQDLGRGWSLTLRLMMSSLKFYCGLGFGYPFGLR